VDGGVVPSYLGVNSSLTISTLAFKIRKNVVSLSNIPVEPVMIGTNIMLS
jgi:hypothetical protein